MIVKIRVEGINKAIFELLEAHKSFSFEFLKENVELVVLKWKKDTSLEFSHLDEYQKNLKNSASKKQIVMWVILPRLAWKMVSVLILIP